MRWLADMPLRRKLVLTIMLVSGVVVLLGAAISVGYEMLRSRRAMVRDLTAQAEIIGANSAAALAFDDTRAAAEILQALAARPEIVYAGLYTPDGKPFAEYTNGRAPEKFASPQVPADPTQWFEGRSIVLFRPIKLSGDVVGSICLRADLRGLRALLMAYVAIAAAIGLLLLLICLALSTRLQRIISDPILQLAGLARRVTAQQDYSLRANKQGQDEIGELVDGFNQMLERIAERDAALRRAFYNLESSEERFRQLAESIEEVFWMTDPEKKEMIYVSPGYEAIWGRTCQSLYHRPTDWLEAIHPDDRERVRAALPSQLTGTYDQEYRIVVKGGAIRWIRDRAFPVANADGEVYRVAGLAEDITEQKRMEQEILKISEREQSRIGQDLHDGLGQHLVGTAFSMTELQKALAGNAPLAAAAARIAKLIDEAATQARTLARGLYPVGLRKEGLSFALEHLASTIGSVFNIDCQLDCPVEIQLKDTTIATHLYRIVQEAINNAVKHGHATHVIVKLCATSNRLTLAVEDNGTGMELSDSPPAGMGIHIMHYRARAIGGALEILARPGGGTIVRCACPWQAAV